VKPEKKLYHLFKKNCPDLLITPLEVWNNLGVPDLLLYNKKAIRAPLSSIKLYGSESIKDLSENPDRATPLAVNDWQAINNIFLKK
jgi:hypothetical protein